KTRLGFADGDFTADVFCARMQSAGAAAITVHGRFREQFYAGKADYNLLRETRAAVTVPFIVNGDIESPSDAARIMRETGADGVMLARGALGRPWIFAQIARTVNRSERDKLCNCAVNFENTSEHSRISAQTEETEDNGGVERRYDGTAGFKSAHGHPRVFERQTRIVNCGEKDGTYDTANSGSPLSGAVSLLPAETANTGISCGGISTESRKRLTEFGILKSEAGDDKIIVKAVIMRHIEVLGRFIPERVLADNMKKQLCHYAKITGKTKAVRAAAALIYNKQDLIETVDEFFTSAVIEL
ncbi:MAG: tRNA-dihydrouridine synthase family protein, partial [Clostridiales bacterium]|nr:tRNA-dihydrouridine synthase family protein [Clostridiales bacterium]